MANSPEIPISLIYEHQNKMKEVVCTIATFKSLAIRLINKGFPYVVYGCPSSLIPSGRFIAKNGKIIEENILAGTRTVADLQITN